MECGVLKLQLFMYRGVRAVTGSGRAHCRLSRARHGRHDMMHDARGAHAQASKRTFMALPGILVMLFLTAPSRRRIQVAVRSGRPCWGQARPVSQLAQIHIKCLPGVRLGDGGEVYWRCLLLVHWVVREV